MIGAVVDFLWIGDVVEGRIKDLKSGFDFDKLLDAAGAGLRGEVWRVRRERYA